MEYMAILLFICVCVVLLMGFPVAFSLAGAALIFAGIGSQNLTCMYISLSISRGQTSGPPPSPVQVPAPSP